MGWSGRRQRSEGATIDDDAPPGGVTGGPACGGGQRPAGARVVGHPQAVHTSRNDSGRGWRTGAARAGMGPALFFPDGERADVAVEDVRRAKAVCAGCPVRAACLEFALVTHQDYGVWGGTSESERYQLRRAG